MTVEDLLSDLHAAFLKALKADPSPAADMAVFWYEVIRFDRDKGTAASRGTSFLRYQKASRSVGDVPGQDFPVELLPAKRCQALLTEHAKSLDGPRSLSFRYDRVDGHWVGGYSWETSAMYLALAEARAKLDNEMSAALASAWRGGIKSLMFVYGAPIADTEVGPRPKLQFLLEPRGSEFEDPPADVLGLWQQYERLVSSFGHRHLYYAEFRLESPTEKLASVQLRYGA